MRSSATLLFLPSTLEVGGSETKVVRIANALARSGFDIHVAYLNPPDALLSKIAANVKVTHLKRRGKYSVYSLRKLGHLLAARRHVIFAVNFYPLLYAVPALCCKRHHRHRLIGLINTTTFPEGQQALGHLYAPFIRRCHRIVFGCAAQEAEWIKRYWLPENKCMHIYNGVDASYYDVAAQMNDAAAFRALHNIPPDALVIGSVGRLAPEKNFSLLVDAIAAMKARGRSAYLILVGDGQQRESIRQQAKAQGIDKAVVLTGSLQDTRPAVSAMDIFVLPSKAVETFSNAALEAMSLSRPVALSAIGGAAEMITHGDDGYLFKSGDKESLMELLVHLFDDSKERERVGHAARKRVIRDFRFEQMVKRYADLAEIELLES